MERYNRDFNNLFDSPNPGLFVFCVRVREEMKRCEKWNGDALKGSFTIRKGGKEVLWLEVPQDFEGWEPKKRMGEKGNK